MNWKSLLEEALGYADCSQQIVNEPTALNSSAAAMVTNNLYAWNWNVFEMPS
jgi:hypothetical protein